MAVKRNYRINLRNYGNPPAIMVSQYDENYDLVFEVYDGVVPATGLNSYTVKLAGRQPGNDPALKYEFTGTVSGIANNILSFTIDTTMTGRAGKGTAEIVILDTTNDVKFASFNLPVYVEKAAVPDDAIDADVERAQEIAEQVEELIDGATEGAEAWAVGQRGGVDVESTDPTYHNNAKYYSEVAQDIADSIGIDATLSISGKAADAKKTGDEISSLNEDLNAKITNPSEGEEGQILTNDGQGGAVWSNAGTPTDAQVGEAVETWLENHPEATTTVEDGSLTEVKFSDALKKVTVKEYVTPEMFGAVGDGNADDTQAIRDMLATDAKYYVFSKPVYKITDSIDFTKDWSTIVFNNTQIKVIHTGSELIEYGVGFKAAMLKTIGLLRVTVARHAYIGIWMQGVHGSVFDDIYVEGAIIWGLYMFDRSGGGNNTVTINCFRAGSCGITYFAKGKYVSATEMAITDIDYSGYSSFTDAQKLKVFGGDYRQIVQIVDDSGYTKNGVQNRIVYNTRLDQPITLDPEDLTKGTYVTGGNIYNIQSDYADGDNGRNIAIPIGGGAKFGSSASEGGLSVRRMSITSCAKALDMGYAYGGEIGSFMCESCTLMIVTRFICWWLTIGYLYTEAIGNLLKTNDKKSLFLVCNDSSTTVSVNIATSKFDLSNVAVLNMQAGVGSFRNPLIQISENIYKSTSFNVSADQFFGQTINEYSPRVLTYNASQLSTVATYAPFTLDITNPNDYKNGFSPFTIYVRNTSGNVNAQKLRIGIKANALNQGYSIYGAVDNILTVDGSSLGNNYKVTVMLFGKVFYVTAEALSYVDNTQA